ncbi:MAG: hypothetical protein LWW97_05090 [Deltaproteobacteria bacterium]|nr:hypothetical protein [Deltaproteobacteria bacterium]
MNDTYTYILDNGGIRSGVERRNFSYTNYFPERRSDKDRRNWVDRRNGVDRRKSVMLTKKV